MRRLRFDRRGSTLVEFGFIAPMFMMFLIGAFDIGHALYLRSAMLGAMQKSARDSTLEQSATAASQARIDGEVQKAVDGLTFGKQIQFKRRFYRTFQTAAAARAEQFTDINLNGRCDGVEPYSDDNNNNVWDADGGNEGQGLAFDRSVYTATVTYQRLFPLWKFIGGSPTSTVQVRTVLMNQPYTGQTAIRPPTQRNCA
jgi:Flp pilus assembly protein TadG